MSDYRPWDSKEAPTAASEVAEDERFQLPPGLDAAPQPARRGPRLSAALLLGVAGFVFFAGMFTFAIMEFVILVETLERGAVNPDIRGAHAASIWAMLMGAALAVPAVGLLYDQPWAKPAAAVASAIALLPPFTAWGVLSLVHLGRRP